MSDRAWPVPQRSHFMRMNWLDLLFMHWPLEPVQLRELIPQPLSVDCWENQAWISIVPFRMTDVSLRLSPELPFISAFPELNVRTYVTFANRPGVWFFSLDATSRIAVRVARRCFHLPYMDARISLQYTHNRIHYRSQRFHHGEPNARLDVEYRGMGEAFTSAPDSLEHFLTARYCMYMADRKQRLYCGEIDHLPWQLQHAEVSINENTMTRWLSIDTESTLPIAHFALPIQVSAWTKERLQKNGSSISKLG